MPSDWPRITCQQVMDQGRKATLQALLRGQLPVSSARRRQHTRVSIHPLPCPHGVALHRAITKPPCVLLLSVDSPREGEVSFLGFILVCDPGWSHFRRKKKHTDASHITL